jgi:hypothetical protein
MRNYSLFRIEAAGISKTGNCIPVQNCHFACIVDFHDIDLCETISADTTAQNHKRFPFLRMPSSGMWRCVDPVTADVSEEFVVPIIRVERISKLRMTLAVTGKLVTDKIFLAR